jgi:hypothetical protein
MFLTSVGERYAMTSVEERYAAISYTLRLLCFLLLFFDTILWSAKIWGLCHNPHSAYPIMPYSQVGCKFELFSY